MEIKDLAGLSKPLSKLISVISRGTGNVSASYLVKKRTGAKVDEIEKVAAAIQKASGETGLAITYRDGAVEMVSSDASVRLVSDVTIEAAASSREAYQSRVSQENIEAITSIAAEQLVGQEATSHDDVEQDWINRFFRYAEDVSSEEMQKVWARLLAGEVQRPGSFSLRTMEFVRGLSVAEGRLLNSLSACVFKHGPYTFIPWSEGSEVGGRISQATRYELAELGVLYPEDLHLRMFMSPVLMRIERGDEAIHIEPSNPPREIQFPIAKLTALGAELLELVGTVPNIELTNAIGKFFVGQGCPVTYGRILSRTATGIQFLKLRYHAPGAEEVSINPAT